MSVIDDIRNEKQYTILEWVSVNKIKTSQKGRMLMGGAIRKYCIKHRIFMSIKYYRGSKATTYPASLLSAFFDASSYQFRFARKGSTQPSVNPPTSEFWTNGEDKKSIDVAEQIETTIVIVEKEQPNTALQQEIELCRLELELIKQRPSESPKEEGTTPIVATIVIVGAIVVFSLLFN